MGHFGAFLGVFGIFEVLVEIWGILRVLVSCKITRGIKLVVGRVTERVLGACMLGLAENQSCSRFQDRCIPM